jgi:hypothetical protein
MDDIDRVQRAETADPSLADVLSLIGTRVLVLSDGVDGQGGGDLDLAVDGLDPLWPLRLPSGWRLSQVLHYDAKGWYWVLEHAGRAVAIDTVDDPRGLGRDAIPTRLLIDLSAKEPEAARAAYLTAKRIRKSITERSEWERIAAMAAEAPDAYRSALTWVFGDRLASRLAAAVLGGSVPSSDVRRAARSAQWLARRSRPGDLAASTLASATRWFTRSVRATGMLVVVAGPDGAGKSTLAEALPDLCAGPFRRSMHRHWRPGVLPRAGALVGAPSSDARAPQGRPPHSKAASLASLVYHWLDFLIGSWAVFMVFRLRSGLVVLERGYWDVVVDPRRYRLTVPEPIVRALGRLLPRPDLVLVLEAPPDVLRARKAELTTEELLRQTRAWRTALPPGVRARHLDAARSTKEIRTLARAAVFDVLAARSARGLGSGWIGVPSRSSPRWTVPRGPRRAARTAVSIYQPVTMRGRVGWEAGRALGALGLLRLWPRGSAPDEHVRTAVAHHLVRGATMAVQRANHPGRFLALLVGPAGDAYAVAKVASDDAGCAALDVEAANIDRFAPLLESPLRAPRVLDRARGILVLEAIAWRPRIRPWVLPREVAGALGRAHARSRLELGNGMAHGDCAPWNLLQAEGGWALVDWENATADAPAFFDVFHYLVQAHVLLGRPSLRALVEPSERPAWIVSAFDAYATEAGLPRSGWRDALVEYLRTSRARLDPSILEQAEAVAVRERLLAAVSAHG